jgi:hypothetical protein
MDTIIIKFYDFYIYYHICHTILSLSVIITFLELCVKEVHFPFHQL